MRRSLLALTAAFAPSVCCAVACSVTSPTLSFGNYDVFSATPLQSSATMTVACQKQAGDSSSVAVAYTIALSTGSSASYATRTLRSGAETLNYNLYTNSSRTLIWGNGTGGSQLVANSFTLNNSNPSRSRNHTVYGSVSALQNAGVASYSDSILITVTY